jgi:acetolactate synthase regulatory subunit
VRNASHHAFFVRRRHEHRYFGVISGNAAHFVESSRVAVALIVESDAHAVQALQG